MPEWIVSTIVAAIVVFIVFVMTTVIVFLMELPSILETIRRQIDYDAQHRGKK